MLFSRSLRALALIPVLSAAATLSGAACSSTSSSDTPPPGACTASCTDGGDAATTSPDGGCSACLGATRLSGGDGNGPRFDGCIFGSPLAFGEGATRRILVASASGEIAAIVPHSGATDWQLMLPAPAGEVSSVVATPVLVGSRAVVSYHTRAQGSSPHVGEDRLRHRLAVVDLEKHELDPAFPVVEFAAQIPAAGGSVPFEAGQSIGRGALVHGVPPGSTLGRVYVTFGNVRDLQPWHGWVFEVDLDAWKSGGASKATNAVFLTTPETDCGPRGSSGSRERKCGGGLWAPSGPLLYPDGDAYALIVGPGNGQLDLARRDYANTLLRLRPGLAFEHGCDAAACAAFDPDAPAAACIDSCRDLFVPRLPAGQSYVPESGACDGMNFFQCWQALDYIGGSTPVRVRAGQGRFAFAYPTKDGALYLVDGERMGTMHDRAQLVPVCGTKSDPCTMDWAGMIVTQPAVIARGDEDVVIVPTFMPDATHPGGVVALRVRTDGATPKLERLWEFPRFDTPDARRRFRNHPSRLTPATLPRVGEAYGFVVEATPARGRGWLLALRLSDGAVGLDVPLASGGMRFSAPLVDDDAVYVSSCASDSGPGSLEAFRIDVNPHPR